MWPFRKKNTDLDYISIWPEKELKKDEQGRYVSYESRRKNIQSKNKQRVNPNTPTRPKNTGDRNNRFGNQVIRKNPNHRTNVQSKSKSCNGQPRDSKGRFVSSSSPQTKKKKR